MKKTQQTNSATQSQKKTATAVEATNVAKTAVKAAATSASGTVAKTTPVTQTTGQTSTASGVVKTGDTAPIGLWSVLMAGSFGVFETFRRRNKKRQ